MIRSAALLVTVAIVAAGCSGSAPADTSGTPDPTVSADTSTVPSTDPAASSDLTAYFDAVRVRVIDADGVECELCLWSADTDAERLRGLMLVTDLGGASGMLFSFSSPMSRGFWMKDTLIPLDVAFYDADGAFMGSDTMEPCPPGSDDCPVYPAPVGYSWAIEVPAGEAAVFGMEPGGRIVVEGPCDPNAVTG